MNRICERFQALQDRGEKALVGFLTAGDPDLCSSQRLIEAMIEGGADIIELGVPFSDPTADGPVIQRASQRALKKGMKLAAVFPMIRKLRKCSSVPLVIFSYYNPIFSYGLEAFVADASEAGADGVLVVDLPPEEAHELTGRLPDRELALIRLIAPTTPKERMAEIARDASGFLYLVSMTGVTGSAGLDAAEVSRTLSSLKAVTGLPVCVGFGISRAEQVGAIAPLADGVVVGSAFVRLIESNMEDPGCAGKLRKLVEELKDATRSLR